MSNLTEEKKLIWLGLKRPQSDTSVVYSDIERLKNNVGSYSTFQSDLDAYDLDNDGTDENISNYTDFDTYLTDNGFSSSQADTFINRIKTNFTDSDSSGSTYDEFEDYVENTATSYAELKNAFESSSVIGSDQETSDGQKVAGIRFFEQDGYSKDGELVPAGGAEIFANEIHFSETGAPRASSSDISYSNLTVSDTTPEVGQDVDISADITNNGGLRGSVFAPLLEDGSVVDSERVEIPANTTKTVTFTRSYDEYKSVDVTINDLPEENISVIPPGL